MAGSTRGVLLAVVGVAVALSCTRDNPAFGDSADGDKTTGDDGETIASGDDGRTDADDDGGPGSNSSTTGGDDDPADASVDDGLDDGTSDTLGATTGTAECDRPKPTLFDVEAVDENTGDSVPPMCGGVVTFRGAVGSGAMPHEITIAVCPDSSCNCEALAEPVVLTFVDLVPSPADQLEGQTNPCVALMVSRRSEDDGCGVEWIAMETLVVSADFPAYMATSAAEPSWSLVVPPATLGEPIDVCEVGDCGVDPQPGDYELMVGDVGPIEPGGTVGGVFNPYAGIEAPYDVTALFARVDSSCTPFLGWAAIATR